MTANVPGYRLTLKPGGKFVITKREIEWSCFYKGKYSIENDTLKLFRTDIQHITGNAFSDTYLVGKDNIFLVPFSANAFIGDTARWLILALDTNYP